jgi:hypothetical protein
MIFFSDIVGFVGVFFLISAYAGLTFKIICAESLAYPSMNLFASLCLSYSLLYSLNISSLIIEIFWGCISLYGLWQYYRKTTHNASI